MSWVHSSSSSRGKVDLIESGLLIWLITSSSLLFYNCDLFDIFDTPDILELAIDLTEIASSGMPEPCCSGLPGLVLVTPASRMRSSNRLRFSSLSFSFSTNLLTSALMTVVATEGALGLCWPWYLDLNLLTRSDLSCSRCWIFSSFSLRA